MSHVSGDSLLVTAEEFYRLPETERRWELVGGKVIVNPPPTYRHQVIVRRLFVALYAYLEPLGLGETVFNLDSALWMTEIDVLSPDVWVAHPDALTGEWRDIDRLLLVAEVLSPSTKKRDRIVKRDLYLRHPVPTYWIIDATAQSVEAWTPGATEPRVVTHALTWRVGDNAPEFILSLAELFRA